MGYIEVLTLSVVEGLTEFLPVSSTGHLILTAKLMGIGAGEFLKTFEISIQLGAILAVVFLYGWPVIVSRKILTRIIAGFIPTGLLGFLFYDFVKILLDSPQVVVWSLGIGGVVIVIFERLRNKSTGRDDIAMIPISSAMLIGLFQALSMVPGVSRAAATIIGGEVSGLSRRAAVEFSFLLALPTMAAATTLDIWSNGSSFSDGQWIQLLVGGAISFFVALTTMRFLLRYIRSHDLSVFGWYRIVLAGVFALFVL